MEGAQEGDSSFDTVEAEQVEGANITLSSVYLIPARRTLHCGRP
jgi:hypothetical protein